MRNCFVSTLNFNLELFQERQSGYRLNNFHALENKFEKGEWLHSRSFQILFQTYIDPFRHLPVDGELALADLKNIGRKVLYGRDAKAGQSAHGH